MGWDKGRYYTRSKKVNGRVVRQYVGAGPAAELAAQRDAKEREIRATERAAFRSEVAELVNLDKSLNELHDLVELVARAALAAAAYRQHKRGEWRQQRARRN